MFKSLKKMAVSAFAAAAGLFLTASVAIAQSTNPLVTAATGETANTKGDLLALGAVVIVIAVVTWGIFKLIGMFGRK